MKNTVIALLPMKGHSERVPNKNIRLIDGKPLLFYVANSLQQCDNVHSIIINTDSDEIANIAKKHFSKVVIHERPKELCGDFVSMNKIIEHDISLLSDERFFLQTHSTNPLVSVATFERAISSYFSLLTRNDSLFSVTPLQIRLYTKDGSPINHNPKELLRTQDLTPIFHENSCIYIFSRESFHAAGQKRIGVTPQMFEMEKTEAIDIDDMADFMVAEALLQSASQQL